MESKKVTLATTTIPVIINRLPKTTITSFKLSFLVEIP